MMWYWLKGREGKPCSNIDIFKVEGPPCCVSDWELPTDFYTSRH